MSTRELTGGCARRVKDGAREGCCDWRSSEGSGSWGDVVGSRRTLWERLVLMNQHNFSVTIGSFSVLKVWGHFSA